MTLNDSIGIGDENKRHCIDPVTAVYLGIGNGLKFLNAHWPIGPRVKMDCL
jgi:hypothetical protein